MNSGIFDLYVNQESEFFVEFEYTDSDDNPITITTNLEFVVRRSSVNSKNLFTINSNGEMNEEDEFYSSTDYITGEILIHQNEFSVRIYSELMKMVKPGQYFYYIFINDVLGKKPLLKGRFYIETP
jgi:hypothetical protein